MVTNLKIVSLAILLLSIVSCSDFLDVDEDFDNPKIAPNEQLFTGININIGLLNNFRLWSGDILQVYTHQFTAREEEDQYGARPGNILVNNDWENIYLTLTDIEDLISQATEANNQVIIGYTQILKAHMISVAVDLWGDVPFTEATGLNSGLVSPKFDDQVEIYQAVLNLFDEAKRNINSGNGSVPAAADLFYGGNNEQWIKLANSLKLKLYNQIRLSDLFMTTDNQAGFAALIAEGNFFENNEDDFQYVHTATQAPRDERNQLYRDAYVGQQVTKYASPWFYEILIGVNPNIHTSNPDPRLPYYFVNQLEDDQFPRDQGNSITGNPNADYWDKSTGFFTIRFGSTGPARDNAVQTDATFPGIFPCGGRYDDNEGFSRTSTSGTSVAPRRIFTYDEFLYVQAELIHEGLLAGDETMKLREAITASFAKVDQVVAGTGTTQVVPVLAGATETTAFIDNIITEFGAANAEKKLEIIMTQKWVATFADPMDQYNDIRRTGFPILADPNSTDREYQLDNGDGFPLNDSFTQLNNTYPLSLFWPRTELNLNQNAPAQKNPATYRIFWDVDN